MSRWSLARERAGDAAGCRVTDDPTWKELALAFARELGIAHQVIEIQKGQLRTLNACLQAHEAMDDGDTETAMDALARLEEWS